MICQESIVSDDIGVELTISIITGSAAGFSSGDVDVSKSGFGTMLYGKYYFGPDLGGDRLYAGLYLRQKGIEYKGEDDNSVYASFKRDIVAIGIGTGYKYVSDKNVS